VTACLLAVESVPVPDGALARSVRGGRGGVGDHLFEPRLLHGTRQVRLRPLRRGYRFLTLL